jgi:hypothetical protein
MSISCIDCGSSGGQKRSAAESGGLHPAYSPCPCAIFPVKNKQLRNSCAKADFLAAGQPFVKQSFLAKALQAQLFFQRTSLKD